MVKWFSGVYLKHISQNVASGALTGPSRGLTRLRRVLCATLRVIHLPPLALRATDAGSLINALVPVITDFGPDNRGYSPTIRVANVYVAVAAGTPAAGAGRRRRTAVGGAVGATTVGAIGTTATVNYHTYSSIYVSYVQQYVRTYHKYRYSSTYVRIST